MAKKWIPSGTVEERIRSAQEKLDRIVERVLSGLVLRESNRQLLKGKLSRQIPLSRAANCYNALIESQLKYETLLLSSLWDKGSKDRNSIPSVLELVDDTAVRRQLRKNAEEQYPATDPAGTLTNYYTTRRKEEVANFDKRIDKAFGLSSSVHAIPEFNNLRNFRDFEIAHSITVSSPAVDLTKIPLAEPFWDQTIECLDNLNSTVRLSGFDFEGSKNMHLRSAEEFWGNLKFRLEP
jgi:AbiU2